jgi:hypothetical protein
LAVTIAPRESPLPPPGGANAELGTETGWNEEAPVTTASMPIKPRAFLAATHFDAKFFMWLEFPLIVLMA